MRRKSFSEMECPIARGLERVGEWWSMLILRDALHGLTRFDEFQKSLSIAPNMLTRRLSSLVEAGLLERRRYSEHPPRDEYITTEKARDFRPVLLALLVWGNKHYSEEGYTFEVVDPQTGKVVDPVIIDRHSGRPLEDVVYQFVKGSMCQAAADAAAAEREKNGPNGGAKKKAAKKKAARK